MNTEVNVRRIWLMSQRRAGLRCTERSFWNPQGLENESYSEVCLLHPLYLLSLAWLSLHSFGVPFSVWLLVFLMLLSFFSSTCSPQVAGQSSSELSRANENPMLSFSQCMKTDLEAPQHCTRSRLHNMDMILVQKQLWGVEVDQKTNFKSLQCLASLNPGYLG